MTTQLQEAYEDLKALAGAREIMGEDTHVLTALGIAAQRMQQAAYNYALSVQGGRTAAHVPPQIRGPAHRPPGVSDDRQKPYSRTQVQPPTGGVSPAAASGAIPGPPPAAGTPPAPVQRVAPAGIPTAIPTAPGLPDAIVPQGAMLHPRTLTRMQQAITQDGVQLPAPAPGPGGDLPDVPMMPPSEAPPLT